MVRGCDAMDAMQRAVGQNKAQDEDKMADVEAECGRGSSTGDTFLVMAEGKVIAAWRKVDGTLLAFAQ